VGSELAQYGSNLLWQKTGDFNAALARLDALKMPKELKSLCEAMSQKGLALEHEVVWLE
jgi:hypothetical protein